MVNVLRHVENNREIAALPCQASAATAGEHRNVEVMTGCNGLDYIIDVLWHDHADRDLAIVRAVGGIQGSAAVIKPDLATHPGAQLQG